MSNGILNNEQCLRQARDLVGFLEAGDREGAEKALGGLTRIHETEVYQELGKLTRELHSTLCGIEIDDRMADLAHHEIPDAKERLNYVIEMTDRAAHKTLGAVEKAIPICDEIVASTSDIRDKWKKFVSRDMNADEFRAMAREIGSYLDASSDQTGLLRESLNDILMAQDFQDLTGQTIRRVINLVQELEESLVAIIRLSSPGKYTEAEERGRNKEGLQGPQIPGREDSDAMKSQDEVDDLLSSLGF